LSISFHTAGQRRPAPVPDGSAAFPVRFAPPRWAGPSPGQFQQPVPGGPAPAELPAV